MGMKWKTTWNTSCTVSEVVVFRNETSEERAENVSELRFLAGEQIMWKRWKLSGFKSLPWVQRRVLTCAGRQWDAGIMLIMPLQCTGMVLPSLILGGCYDPWGRMARWQWKSCNCQTGAEAVETSWHTLSHIRMNAVCGALAQQMLQGRNNLGRKHSGCAWWGSAVGSLPPWDALG